MNHIDRKNQHIELALAQSEPRSPFDRLRITHRALPEVNLSDIDLSTTLLGHRQRAPLFISSMTGGPARAETINRHLAEACQETGLAMGVGSQRIGLERGETAGLAESIRHAIGKQPLFANFGAVNLRTLSALSELNRILDPLEADALILHLNPMQEVFQTGGDTDWSGVLDAIAATCDWCPVPVIVKEVGFGLDPVSAEQLLDAGVSLLDVAGRGGTRFDRIEQQLAHPEGATPEEVFADWGLTTVESLRAIKAVRANAPLVASGGIRNGLDLAKSLCLGAQAGGIAGAVLQDALISTDAVVATLSRFTDDLKIACFGAGVGSVSEWGAQHIEDIA